MLEESIEDYDEPCQESTVSPNGVDVKCGMPKGHDGVHKGSTLRGNIFSCVQWRSSTDEPSNQVKRTGPDLIGFMCLVHDNDGGDKVLAIVKEYENGTDYPYRTELGICYKAAEEATREELLNLKNFTENK